MEVSLHLKKFNDRIKVMNQTNAKDLTLTKIEAQNLHNDIFDLLTQIAELTKIKKENDADQEISVEMDGGNF